MISKQCSRAFHELIEEIHNHLRWTSTIVPVSQMRQERPESHREGLAELGFEPWHLAARSLFIVSLYVR